MLLYIGGIVSSNIIVVDAKDRLVGEYTNLDTAYVAAVRESVDYNEAQIFVAVLDKHCGWYKHSYFYNGELCNVYRYKDKTWNEVVLQLKEHSMKAKA